MTASEHAAALRTGCRVLLGAEPGQEQLQRLLAYLDLLVRWNGAYNLTSVRDPGQMVTRHLLDSLAILPWCTAGRLLDVGAGAGLPGVPLAIMQPALDVTLLDSAGKKVRFLRQVRRELDLPNIRPLQQRVEDYAPDLAFDAVVSRAFGSLEAFACAVRHLLAPGTRLLAMKGRRPESEIAALPVWIRLDSVERLEVPGLQEERHLVIMSLSP